jgi:short subunit dehydrogenase-like uncharacterized protein
LAKKTRCIITTVGPYAQYGEPVVAACAKNGTHYVDCTGEIPWVLDMIEKYHDIAKGTGAILIPQCGLESAPSDLCALSLVTVVREKLSVGVKEVILALVKISGSISGGTAASALGLMQTYSIPKILKASEPWAFSPTPGDPSAGPETSIFGIRRDIDLGILTQSITSGINRSQVHRSWGLLGSSLYGPHFRFYEYMKVKTAFRAFIYRFIVNTFFFWMIFPPIRYVS